MTESDVSDFEMVQEEGVKAFRTSQESLQEPISSTASLLIADSSSCKSNESFGREIRILTDYNEFMLKEMLKETKEKEELKIQLEECHVEIELLKAELAAKEQKPVNEEVAESAEFEDKYGLKLQPSRELAVLELLKRQSDAGVDGNGTEIPIARWTQKSVREADKLLPHYWQLRTITLPHNCWLPDACAKNLFFTHNNLTVIGGPIKGSNDGRALALEPIPRARVDGYFYFEILCSRIGYFRVGLGVCVVESEEHTYEYKFNSNGHFHRHELWRDSASGELTTDCQFLGYETVGFGPGDIVGCGFELGTHTLFFTRNGKRLDLTTRVSEFDAERDVFPMVRLRSVDDAVTANFGKWEFAYKNE